MTVTSVSSHESQPLAKLVEDYRVFRYELAAETNRENQETLRLRWRACWTTLRVVLASSALAQEQLATLAGLYLVLWREQREQAITAVQHEFLRTQLRACWQTIQTVLPSQTLAREQLLTLINLYQVLQHEQTTPSAPIPQDLRSYLHTTSELIWIDLSESLTRLASGWLRSGLARNLFTNPTSYASRTDALQTLKLLAFAEIIRQLPTLHIHPHKNVRAYLINIAYWGLYQENSFYHTAGLGSTKKSPASQEAIAPNTPEAAMWSSVEPAATPAEEDFKTRTQEDIYYKQCIAALQSLIERRFPPGHQLILKRRWQDPPVEYATIAAELGSGATEGSVRVQHHRALEKIRLFIETCVLRAMRDPHCAAEVWAAAQQALEPADVTILQMRWRTSPPVDFASIAAELGDHWTENQVRKRHHHAMAFIFAYVRSLGLVDLG